MLANRMLACVMATALTTAPALAQRANPPAPNSPAASGAGAPTLSARTGQNLSAADFVKEAANSDMFEIQSSRLALNKTQDAKVRDFAQRMIQDHTQASEKLKAVARGQTVPTSLDPEHAQKLQQLQQASANDFSRDYVQMQAEGHQKAVSLFENYAQDGDNPELKQFAQQTLPTLRQHLQLTTQIQTASARSGQPAQATAQQYMTEEQPGVWRGSKLINLSVYNDNNERIGDINEVLVNRDGKVEAVVIGVGGFLGMGEHNVAVPFHALQWSMTAPGANTDTRSNAATNRVDTARNTEAIPPPTNRVTGAVGADTTRTDFDTRRTDTAAAGGGRPENAASGSSYPDHAIFPHASKDQLKNAPEFRYSNER
jgi:putative membrane protein